MLGVCGRGGCFRCSWAWWLGYGRDRTTQRGRFPVVLRVPVRIRTGGAQLSGPHTGGHRLLSERVTRPHARANRPILLPSVLVSEGGVLIYSQSCSGLA